jgi:ribonuclease P protein component
VALRHPRNARLLRPSDFAALRERSQRVSTTYFTAQYRMTSDAARLGMAVSRKVSTNAVVRNRIRRQIRESFRLQRARLPTIDVLVIARVTAAAQSNPLLREELAVLWRRLIGSVDASTLNETVQPGTMRAASSTASE